MLAFGGRARGVLAHGTRPQPPTLTPSRAAAGTLAFARPGAVLAHGTRSMITCRPAAHRGSSLPLPTLSSSAALPAGAACHVRLDHRVGAGGRNGRERFRRLGSVSGAIGRTYNKLKVGGARPDNAAAAGGGLAARRRRRAGARRGAARAALRQQLVGEPEVPAPDRRPRLRRRRGGRRARALRAAARAAREDQRLEGGGAEGGVTGVRGVHRGDARAAVGGADARAPRV